MGEENRPLRAGLFIYYFFTWGYRQLEIVFIAMIRQYIETCLKSTKNHSVKNYVKNHS